MAAGLGNKYALKQRPKYQAAHMRIRKVLGTASGRPCELCGRPAHEWAYDHMDSNALRCVVASGLPYGRYHYEVSYSLDPAHYFPSCRSCHRKHDKGR